MIFSRSDFVKIRFLQILAESGIFAIFVIFNEHRLRAIFGDLFRDFFARNFYPFPPPFLYIFIHFINLPGQLTQTSLALGTLLFSRGLVL